MDRASVPLLQRVFFPNGWGTPRDRRNWLRFTGMCSVAGLSWVAVTYLIATGRLAVGAPALAGTAVPVGAMLAAMAAYYQFLRQTDELQRRVQVSGLALGFGAGLFWSVVGSMLARAGVVLSDGLGVPGIMLLAYTLGVTVTAHRYGAADW